MEIDSFNNIWIFSSEGDVAVMDSYYNLRRTFNYLAVDRVETCVSHEGSDENSFFCSYIDESGLGVLHFIYNSNNIPKYSDYYVVSENAGYVDIEVEADSLYLATTDGLYMTEIDYDLKISSWSLMSDNQSILGLDNSDGILIITEQDEYIEIINENENTVLAIQENYTNFIDSDIIDNNLFILLQNKFLVFNIENSNFDMMSSEELEEGSYSFLSVNSNNTIVSIMNQGFIINTDTHIIPNTPAMQGYNAIALLDDGSLVAVGTKLNDDQSVYSAGILHYKNQLFKNYIPSYLQSMYKIDSNDDFNTVLVNYKPGEKYSQSIVELKANHIAFSNSGILDQGSTIRGGVVVIDLDSESIDNIFNSETTATLGGMNGIYNSDWETNYTVVSQILNLDDKLYVLNPYNELYGNVLSIYDSEYESWSGINVGNDALYLPQGLAIDRNNQIWIGFMNEPTLHPPPGVPYSDGGIRLVNENNQFTEISNDEVLIGGESSNIWSVDICPYDDFEILWVLSSDGVQGYTIFQNQLSPVSNMDLFTEIPFYRGDRIKCDESSNVWITTTHSGVRTILANNDYTEFWPDYEGLRVDNSGLLSDAIYDIDFNYSNGQIYFATEKGISILHSPFSSVSYKKNDKYEIYFDKNPFITSKHDYVIISNVPMGSTITIMDLNGRILRKIKHDSFTQYIWDGKDSNGTYLNSGIYIVASTTSDNKNSTSKIAIIRDK